MVRATTSFLLFVQPVTMFGKFVKDIIRIQVEASYNPLMTLMRVIWESSYANKHPIIDMNDNMVSNFLPLWLAGKAFQLDENLY
ncbi:hypothetical protein FA13DRAFT_100480 [Coprinellus micaceus]|uniref:Uncharacterized protein n=1 Tax=Coprinellus micaceus TaxID=71717 RepID=A0A4Y7SHX0_COPMI|nr:hypothetical protein FA13DRAFT_100480 [Coprinellus micaceus]